MAVRKSSSGGGKKGLPGILFGNWSGKFRVIGKSLSVIFFILLGGLIFNLDRAGDFGVGLLKYKSLLPYPVSRFLPGGTASEGSAVPEETIEGRVIEVYDGDTATVLVESANRKYKVRFYGIDAPEYAQAGGVAARDALREKILGKNVVVKVIAVDNYRRAVGKILLGARRINLEMVSEGHAWYYQDYAKNEFELAAAQKEAQRRRLGLWSNSKSPQPPWEYRKELKNRKKSKI